MSSSERAEAGRLDRRASLDEALRAGIVSRTAHGVAVAMNDYADRRGTLRGTSYADLAFALRCSASTIRRAVVELVEKGLVARIQRGLGLRRAAYVVAPNSTRGQLATLRASSRCSHRRLHPSRSQEPEGRRPLSTVPVRARANDPDTTARILAAREGPPPGLSSKQRRELVHAAAAYARRYGRQPDRLFGYLVCRLYWTTTAARIRKAPAFVHREARTTLHAAELDARERARRRELARRPYSPPAPRPPGPRDPAAPARPELLDLYLERIEREARNGARPLPFDPEPIDRHG